MKGIRERPTVELPLGLQQILLTVHRNKENKNFSSKKHISEDWFKSTSTVNNNEVYNHWKKAFLYPKLQ